MDISPVPNVPHVRDKLARVTRPYDSDIDDHPRVDDVHQDAHMVRVIELHATASPPEDDRHTISIGHDDGKGRLQDAYPSSSKHRLPSLSDILTLNFLSNHMTPRLRGLILLNLVMLACASTFVVLKEGQDNFDPFIFSLIRFLISAAAFSPFWKTAFKNEQLVKAGVEIGLWAAGGYLTQSIAMVEGDASRGAFLSGFTVVVVPLLAGMMGTAKLKRSTWISVGAALVGMSMLEESGPPASWGDFLSFISAIFFGLQIYRTEYWSKVCGAKTALPMMSIALITIAGITVACAVAAHPMRSMILMQHPHHLKTLIQSVELPWMAILYMALAVTNIGLWWEVIALQDVSSTEAAIIYTLEPLCGAMFAYLVLGDQIGKEGWIGAVLIMGSCLVTQLYGAEKESGSK
jgi:drug/metabolite transporter (DMT)-like permease